MLSQMNTLGFPVTTERDFRHYVYQASEFGRKIETSNGSYTLWEIGNSIELWVQTNLHKRIIGMNPHFHGISRVRAELLKSIARPGQSILDGSLYAWASSSTTSSAVFPFVFDLPDYDTYTHLTLPLNTSVQLAAFAQDLHAFPHQEALQQWLTSQSPTSPSSAQTQTTIYPYPHKTFLVIPHMLFSHDGKIIPHPPSKIILRGQVLATDYMTNPVTLQKFYWALVHSLGCEFDVVADPQIVQGTLINGGFIHGLFWLSGRLL